MSAGERGRAAERRALAFLQRQGLTLIEANYRCRVGEIDLICRDGATVVFVEVRLRRPGAFGDAAASITASKQRRLIAAARHWLAGRAEPPCRFDALLFDHPDQAEPDWLRDAFGA